MHTTALPDLVSRASRAQVFKRSCYAPESYSKLAGWKRMLFDALRVGPKKN